MNHLCIVKLKTSVRMSAMGACSMLSRYIQGAGLPPFKKTIEYYASFTHCHIILYNDTRVYDSVNIWTRTNTYVYNCIYIYLWLSMHNHSWSYGVCLTMNPSESLFGLRTYETERIRNGHSTKHDSASLLQQEHRGLPFSLEVELRGSEDSKTKKCASRRLCQHWS